MFYRYTFRVEYWNDGEYTCVGEYIPFYQDPATTETASVTLTSVRIAEIVALNLTFEDTNTELTTFDAFWLTCVVASKPRIPTTRELNEQLPRRSI